MTVELDGDVTEVRINQREPAPLPNHFYSLGKFQLTKGQKGVVAVSAADAGGIVHADAIQILPAK